MRLRFIMPVIALSAILLTGCAIENDGRTTATPDPATLGEQTFAQWCAPCHGGGGEGFINALNAPALNAEGESHLLTDETILSAIIDGGAESGGAMTPLGDSLSAEQEAAVLQFVHTLWTEEQRAAHAAAGGHTTE